MNESFGLPGVVKCCRGRDCGHGAVYLDTWPPVTRIYDIYRSVSRHVYLDTCI